MKWKTFVFSLVFFFQDHLFHQFQNHIYELCLDLYGCRVIQCILIHGSPIHRNAIFNEIYQHSDALLRLIQDRYGNYVIQHAIRMSYLFYLFIFCIQKM